MNRIQKETCGNDWTALLPFALFQVWNTPGRFKLIPYEILCGEPLLLTELGGMYNPDAILSRPLFSRLKALEVARHQIWEQLKEVCISAWIHASHMKRAPELPLLQYLGLLTTLPVKRLVFGGLIIDGLLLRLCNETLKSPKTPDTGYLVPGLGR